MLFNLNMRHHQGSLVAGGEPSLSHLTTQLRTRPGNTVAQNISLHKETFIRIDHELPVQTQEVFFGASLLSLSCALPDVQFFMFDSLILATRAREGRLCFH